MLTIIIYGIINGLQIGLIALAFQLNLKVLKMFDLSQAGLYITSSYFFLLFYNQIHILENIPVLIFLTFVASIGSILISLLIYKFIYTPFFKKNTGTVSLLIISLVVYMILINMVVLLFSSDIQVVDLGKLSYDSVEILGVIITKIQILQVAISISLISISFYLFYKTSFRKKIIAISENEQLYSILGYNSSKLKLKAIVFSTILISFASVLKTIDIGIEPFNTGFNVFLLGAIAVIVGGVHSFKGAILGSLFLGVITNLSSWFLSGQWEQAVTFSVLVLALLIKKDGFFNIKLRLEQ